jgi:DNA-binding NarL/FixJ family response regulator
VRSHRVNDLICVSGRNRSFARCDATRFDASVTPVRQPSPAIGRPLTGRELQIATLIAQGATNREAAVALALSPKTVGAHLQRIYRKLGIHRRSQLAYLIGSATGPGPHDGGAGRSASRQTAGSTVDVSG